MGQAKLEVIDVSMEELEEILHRIETNQSTPEDHKTIREFIESHIHLLALLKDKDTSIGRLRKLLFGDQTEKLAAVLGGSAEEGSAPSSEDGDDSASTEDSASAEDSKPPPKGHGRNGADAYSGAETIRVPHESLQPGDPCPECQDGTVYETNRPRVLIRIVGQAPVEARVYKLQRLRCSLCGKVFSAAVPPDAVGEKHDVTVASMIALLKYGCGLPFNRLQGLQRYLGMPLPASTQWDIVHGAVPIISPAYEELIRQGAQGDVLHNDDTPARILELMGQRAKQHSFAAECLPGSGKKPASARRGLFTSGVVSLSAGHRIALFFTGRQHAGENLQDVLAQRAAGLNTPLQMCDALSRNMPADLATIVANCLAHARRHFVDVVEHFPVQCRHVLEALSVVYKNDAEARKQNLSPEARLRLHQAESGPVMEKLHHWLTEELDQKRVEPNSGLGQAITYLLKHWEKLTRFLQVPGAPLDNNLCERALKKAILHRKNALFFKTQNGAHVGDIYMSLIHTCELNQANPFDYLTELLRHPEAVAAHPDRWMPWNYRESLEPLQPAA